MSIELTGLMRNAGWYPKGSTCTRYFMQGSGDGLAEPRKFELLSDRVIAQRETRQGEPTSLPAFDTYRSWLYIGETLVGNPYVVQMLDPTDDASMYPRDTSTERRLTIDIPCQDSAYIRFRPKIHGIQDAGLRYVKPNLSNPKWRDQIELKKRGDDDFWVLMLGRYFLPFYKSDNYIETTSGLIFGQVVNIIEQGKYHWNGHSIGYTSDSHGPYRTESLRVTKPDHSAILLHSSRTDYGNMQTAVEQLGVDGHSQVSELIADGEGLNLQFGNQVVTFPTKILPGSMMDRGHTFSSVSSPKDICEAICSQVQAINSLIDQGGQHLNLKPIAQTAYY